MAIYDKLRGKRSEDISAAAFSPTTPYVFKNGGFFKSNTGGGTVVVQYFDESVDTWTLSANELVDYVVVKAIIGGTATDVKAIHLAG